MKFKKQINSLFEKGSKGKRFKFKKQKKFKCELCERIVVNHKHIKVRKNYPFGKKSKPNINYTHRMDGGCLVELRKKDEFKSTSNRNN